MILEGYLSYFDPLHYLQLSYNTMTFTWREESKKLNIAGFE